ncbi:ARABIDOPSIS THALIANA KUNITZ TRYPSIN INHIBITOR 5 [Hibiscus trionum]|uniref:ARABIDOPSIS THALIANA KUNITZ TRYPSIN INHIBITOR 5 n=1 Tax=Hibiscus trionum TaxID=183268 RepID=A0A9W7JCU2_HIBTR|nr:ARABIDOPSIS THALIANA KUNITZ TRYPSIN INHIBITOR 5 [Hibiscus trionum]
MKTTTASLFLLFIFSITQSSFLFGVANATNDAVLDVNGDEVLVGVRYYVVSAIWGAGGGGLAIGRESDRKCPEIVVQRRRDVDYGHPVVFSNANSNDGVVRVSSDVRVKFEGPRDRLCLTSTVWKVQDKAESSGKRWVELGGSEGEPGCDTVNSWFKIEASFGSGMYKFKYCPSVCSSYATSCNVIEKDQDTDGQIRLALSDDGTGYPWIFIKADEANARIRQVVAA